MRKKKHSEHPNHERWLVSYADFITLLFAFFVVMYAMSQADLTKFKKVSESLKTAFSGEKSLSGQKEGTGAGQSALEKEVPQKTVAATPENPNQELNLFQDLLEGVIQLESGVSDLSSKMEVLKDERGLLVRLAVKDFFPEKAVEVPAELRPVLERIGSILLKSPYGIRIEGHSDVAESQSLGQASKSSSWDLSASRAAWVARFWISRLKMKPERLAIAGYGHYRPLTQDRGSWARGGNRRIEIIVLNSKYGKAESLPPADLHP